MLIEINTVSESHIVNDVWSLHRYFDFNCSCIVVNHFVSPIRLIDAIFFFPDNYISLT